MKKKERLLTAIIFAAALFLWGAITVFKNPGTRIRITVNGTEYGTYSLSKDQIIPINDTNVCEIKDGKAKMISAACPDHLCLKQKAIDKSGGLIVCLPNKVVIEGENGTGSSGTEDAVTK